MSDSRRQGDRRPCEGPADEGLLSGCRPYLISVVGLHNAGKTTIAARMVARWTSLGLRVGIIKHDGHADVSLHDDWEKPGGDTLRFTEAGASFSMVTGGGQTLLRTARDPHAGSPESLARRMADFACETNAPLDIILVEGYKSSAMPKIVVLREDHAEWLRAAALPMVRAIVLNQSESLHQVADLGSPVYHETKLSDLCDKLWSDWIEGST